MTKTVAVIGAGAAGLAAVKCALDEGLQPTAFEKDPWLGGIWRYTDDHTKSNCIAHSTVTNTSKHLLCFSDFPIPKDFPNFLPHKLFQEYFEMYAEHFDLVDKIRFETEVTAVTRSADHDSTGRWTVRWRSLADNEVKEETFEFVMVCTGINQVPLVPKIDGLDLFEGEVLHSSAYKTWRPLEGKRVLIVGLGNTGGEIACELSRHASQVYLSTRSGAWVTPRLLNGGIPLDLVLHTRARTFIPPALMGQARARELAAIFNPFGFGLQPKDLPHRQFPITNDDLAQRIITGRLIVKGDLASVKGKRVCFKDGSALDDIDTILLATGFQMVFPVVEDAVLNTAKSHIPLYKYVFPPTARNATLAVIGAVRVAGPTPPLEEMQARWVCRVFTGKCSLPTPDAMMADVLKEQEDLSNRFAKSTKTYHLVYSYVEYMDDIGCLLGVTPGFLSLLWRDPGLALRCAFGPCVPAQYRLVGPGAWEGARDVIYGVQESMALPLQTRKAATQKSMHKGHLSAVILAGSLIVSYGALRLVF